MDKIELRDGSVNIQGWALALDNDFSRYAFSVNDEIFDEIHYPLPREDIANLFWYLPGAVNSGFTCQAKIKPGSLFPNGYATFCFINRQTSLPLRQEHNYYCFDEVKDKQIPIPDKKRMIRIQGTSSEITFRLEGFTNFMKLKFILNKTTGKEYNDFSNILDWGCGCGRTTRYFSMVKNALVTGTDVDGDNIGWCQKNLTFGNFVKIPFSPPTSLPDSSFDMIFGISVFTHLKEKAQFEWLRELNRIACPDAILLMSIHGPDATRRSVLAPEHYIPLKVKGFLDTGLNPDLDDILEGMDYYRDIYHLHHYIKTRWSKYFEIIDIIPGTIGNLQDVVVMKKTNIL